MASGGRRPLLAFHHHRSLRFGPDVRGHFGRRSLPDRRWRQELGGGEQRHSGGIFAGELSRVRSMRAQTIAGKFKKLAALSAEPLWCLSQRRWWQELAGNHRWLALGFRFS